MQAACSYLLMLRFAYHFHVYLFFLLLFELLIIFIVFVYDLILFKSIKFTYDIITSVRLREKDEVEERI